MTTRTNSSPWILSVCSAIVLTLLTIVSICPFTVLSQNSIQDYVASHNTVRSPVYVRPVVWNSTVAAYALKYANTRAVDCKLQHSYNCPYGENIAIGYGSTFTGVAALKLWANEKKFFNYGSNSCSGGDCLHYTQMVWWESIQIGCARVPCKNNAYGGYFVTCNYYPPGNWEGELPY